MNRKKILLILISLAVISTVAALVIFKVKPGSDSKNETPASNNQKAVNACSFFSLDDAKKIFGNNLSEDPKNSQENVTPPPSGLAEAPKTETKISTCGYYEGEVTLTDPSIEPTDQNSQPVPEATAKSSDKNKTTPDDSLLPPGANEENRDKKQQQPSGPVQKVLIVLRETTPEQAKKDFDSSKQKSSENISNLGQEAFWTKIKDFSGNEQGQLTVLNGGYTIIISGQDMSLENSKKIAEVVLSRL